MSTKKAGRKPKKDVVIALYKAVAEYVGDKGGSVIVAGGIQCQQWPSDGLFQFTIAVKCTGRPPKFSKGQPAPPEPK